MPSHIFSPALIALSFTVCIGLATPAFAATSGTPAGTDTDYQTEIAKIAQDPFYQELDKMAETHNALQVSNHINQRVRKDQNLLTVALQWLEVRGLHMADLPTYDGNYLIMYSDYLHNGGDALKRAGNMPRANTMFKNSLLALMSAEAVLMADAKRCEDKSVMNVLRVRTLGPRFDALQEAYKLIPKAAYDNMITVALGEETHHALRRPNLELCTLGVDAMNDMKKQPLHKTEVDDPKTKGKKITHLLLPKGYVYHPKLVPDTAWGALRDGVRDYLKTDWQNRYKIYRGENDTGALVGHLGGDKKTK